MVSRRNCSACSMAGVFLATAYNEGGAVIFHSPKDCGHVAMQMDVSNYYRNLAKGVCDYNPANLFISGIDDKDEIFGGTDKLRQCIDEVVRKVDPNYIVIANSCVSGVIGDDTVAIARQAEREWNIPITAVTCQGFLNGDYYDGFYQAASTIIDKIMKPLPKQPDTVVLISEDGLPSEELEILINYFGLKVEWSFPSYSTVADICNIPSAALSIIMSGTSPSFSGLSKLASLLTEKFNIPAFPYDYPVGLLSVEKWLTAMGKYLGQEQTTQSAYLKEKNKFEAYLTEYKNNFNGKQITFCIGRPFAYFNPSWLLELLNMAEVEFKVILLDVLAEDWCIHMKDYLIEIAPQLDMQEMSVEQAAAICQQSDLVITTHELPDKDLRQVFLSLKPPVGIGGICDFMKKSTRMLRRHVQRGGVLYV